MARDVLLAELCKEVGLLVGPKQVSHAPEAVPDQEAALAPENGR